MKQLLIVSNCPAASTLAIQQAVAAGAKHEDIAGVQVIIKQPLDADADDVLKADGLLLGTTENFGAMSGLIKDFMERIYYPVLEQKQGMPYALFIKAGEDGQGAVSSLQRIITGLRWQEIHAPIICTGKVTEPFLERATELGMTMAAGLEAEIY